MVKTGFFMATLNYTPLTTFDLNRLHKLYDGYYYTNFGYLHRDWIKKGIEWEAISTADKKNLRQVIFNVKLGKSAKNSNNLNMWLAYIEHERGREQWYYQLHSIEQIELLRSRTSIRTDIPKKHTDVLLEKQLSLV